MPRVLSITTPPPHRPPRRVEHIRIGALLGRGGFGSAYRGEYDDPQTGDRQLCCVKFVKPSHIDSWHREAYFGELLAGMPHVIQVLQTSVHATKGGVELVIVTELAEYGSVARCLRDFGPLGERHAKKQVLGLAKALACLHRMFAVHRDVTPHNVLVMDGGTLKLADFGIAKHIMHGRGVANDVLNVDFVPPSALTERVNRWKPAADIYQLGQLLAMLISGEPVRHRTRDVAPLQCSDHMKMVIQRSIGPPGARFESAEAFFAALEKAPAAIRTARPRSLAGKVLVFTGRLSITRRKATALATRAGAIVRPRISRDVDFVVQGEPSRHFKAGSRGSKLIDVVRLRADGYDIGTLTERTFMGLVAVTPGRQPGA